MSIQRIIPYFLLIGLPVFFIVHNWNQQFEYIDLKDILPLLFAYISFTTVVFFLLKLLLKDNIRTSIATTALGSTFFFFGALQDFLNRFQFLSIFSHYSVLLPLLTGVVWFMFFRLRKKQDGDSRMIRFLALLFAVLLFLEMLRLTITLVSRQKIEVDRHSSQKPNSSTSTFPDIYYIVTDEYSSTPALRERFGYDNSHMDSSLSSLGLQVMGGSRSNYNFTPFSIASTLNMDYLHWLKDSIVKSPEDYNHCMLDIRENKVCEILTTHGYDIRNFSIFDLKGSPTPENESFLPLKTKLITGQTLWERVKKDIGHLLLAGPFEISWLSNDLIYAAGKTTDTLLARTIRETQIQSASPRFVYTHLYLPHPPFYVDRNGHRKDLSTLLREKATDPASAYLDYLPYANNRILELISAIRSPKLRPSVIILLSDHGFRGHGQNGKYDFMNYSAMGWPDSAHIHFKDSMTNVNVFPRLLNDLFDEGIPLHMDSLIRLQDASTGNLKN